MDGWITIGTKLDTTKFDQEVSNLENKIDSAEKKQEVINQKTEQYKNELAQVSSEVDRLAQEYEKASAEAERLRQIVKTSGTTSYQGFQANLEYQEQVKQVDKLSAELTKVEAKQQSISNKVAQSNLQYENSVKQVNTLRGKLQQLNVKQAQKQFDSVNKSIQNVQKGLTNSISKIGRMALGVFSVYSAYRLLSSASSTLAQYDEQYATNLEYIRFALAQGIAPILKGLVNLAGQLLSYLNYILSAWFGINMFSNSTAKAFQNMSAGAKSTANSAKEIKKQLAGFDEMNVLGDTQTGTLGGGTGITAPSFDVSGIQGEVPSWLKWIADNKDLVISALAGIAGGLLAIQLGLSPIKGLGIGVMLSGIVYSIMSLLEYLNDPSWENFGSTIQGVGIAIIGLGLLIGNVPVAVAGAIALILGTIYKNWDKIKSFLQDKIDWLTNQSDWIHEKFGDTIGGIYDFAVETLQNLFDYFGGIIESIKMIFDGFITFIKGVFTGDWEMAWEGIKKIFFGILNEIKSMFLAVWNQIINVVKTVGSTVGNIIGSAFKAVVNGVLSAIETILNAPIRAINSLISVINAVPGINLGKLNTFDLPRLKTGGIINYPNRGVMLGGSAIGGEAGSEGVIPLTDSQAMAQLGEAIGRYVTINATVINKMNGRTLSRQIQNIQANKDFAYNL